MGGAAGGAGAVCANVEVVLPKPPVDEPKPPVVEPKNDPPLGAGDVVVLANENPVEGAAAGLPPKKPVEGAGAGLLPKGPPEGAGAAGALPKRPPPPGAGADPKTLGAGELPNAGVEA